ncbi:MAG TPA: DUF6503 family protein [Thermoanaerobaculia bacterium]|jgi:hypothetical protein|nr:DUF6503 family protein [Thermoanaerobaculia bacterium]
MRCQSAVATLARLTAIAAIMLGPPAAAAAKDPKAVEIAHRSMSAMGGEERFAAARLLRFDFAPVRDGKVTSSYHHWWDRRSGDYRLEGVSKEGVPFRVLFNVSTKQGQAWLGERALAGEELAQWLQRAYGRFINDSYWLLMPWKWLDEGVNLAYAGRKTVDGNEYDVVTLSFDNGVGLTSNDRYWAFVSPKSGLMERWEYVLETEEGAPGSAAPTPWTWQDWKESAAGILLCTRKHKLGEGPAVDITFPVAELRAEVPDSEIDALFHPREPLPPAPAPAAAPTPSPAP